MTVPAVKKTRKPQIRPLLAKALGHLVNDGMTIHQAAENAGMTYEAVRLALAKPHVRGELLSLKQARLELETLRSWDKVAKLRDGAESQKVQLEAAKVHLTASGDLSGERNHAPAMSVAIQFVVPEAPMMRVANERGIVEAPAFDPTSYRRLPSIEAVEHADS